MTSGCITLVKQSDGLKIKLQLPQFFLLSMLLSNLGYNEAIRHNFASSCSITKQGEFGDTSTSTIRIVFTSVNIFTPSSLCMSFILIVEWMVHFEGVRETH